MLRTLGGEKDEAATFGSRRELDEGTSSSNIPGEGQDLADQGAVLQHRSQAECEPAKLW